MIVHVLTHALAAIWQRLLAAFIGAAAGTVVSYIKLRALVLVKHEEMKLHITRTVQGRKETP